MWSWWVWRNLAKTTFAAARVFKRITLRQAERTTFVTFMMSVLTGMQASEETCTDSGNNCWYCVLNLVEEPAFLRAALSQLSS